MQAKNQIDFCSTPANQFLTLFQTRFKNLNIVVILLSHSLCEGVINTILSVGLSEVNMAELFSILDKVELKKNGSSHLKQLKIHIHFQKARQCMKHLIN